MQGSDLSGWPSLAEIRRSRKISLETIAAETRIRLDYLKAIESGDFGKLPGGIYTTSYIRQYARLIDFPEHDLVAMFVAATAESTVPQSQGREETPRWSARPRLLRWLGGHVS